MKIIPRYCFLPFLFFVAPIICCFSQDRSKLDSLEILLGKVKDDTGRAIVLCDIAFELRFVNPELALKRAVEAIEICRKVRYKKGEAKAENIVGLAYNALGNYEKAVEYHNNAINSFAEISDSIGIAKALHNIGYAYSITGMTDSAILYYRKSLEISGRMEHYFLTNFNYTKICEIYSAIGDYPRALEYAQLSLNLSEKEGDAEGQSNALNEAGLILMYQKNYDASLQYFFKAESLSGSISDKSMTATILNNIGLLFEKKNQPDEAIKYYLNSLKIKKEVGNLQSVVTSYSNIARIYQSRKNYYKAIEFNRKALAIDEQLDDKAGLCVDYIQLAGVEMILKNYSAAEDMLEKAKTIAGAAGYKDLLVSAYSSLADMYARQNNYEKAYEFHQLYSQMKDSLLNEESSKQITEMQTKYESEKKQNEIELLNKEKKLQNVELEKKEAEVKKQNTQKIAFGTGLVLVLVLALLIFRGYKQKTKNNLLLARQKQQIEIKNSHLETANGEITQQKKEIEEKNHEILASIRYAQRIQEAILPPSKFVKQYLEQSFVLYKPKDIVAGDFYWMHCHPGSGETGNKKILFAACDCTGHGVPGAFVSIVGHNALNRAVKEFSLVKPAEILDKVNELVQETFSKSENEMKDGMDVALCSLEFTREPREEGVDSEKNLSSCSSGFLAKLEYSGANNSMYLIREGNLAEVKADKQPIGNFIDRKPFSNHEIELQKGDVVYLFSDGYADQFGGPKGKKFKYSQFEKLLVSVQDKPMDEQKEILDSTMEKWRNNLEQIDDICIIGVRV